MSAHRVDYDRLAANYNARYDFNSLEEIAERLEQLAEDCETVLEVGCGTGRWLPEVGRAAALVVGASMFRSACYDKIKANRAL